MTTRALAALLASSALLAGPATAATGNVIFNANVAATCTMTVNSNGTMTVDTALQTLSSHNAGGSAGQVTINTTGGVDLSVDPVTVVTAPTEDVTTTTWTPSYSAAGAHTIAETEDETALTVPGTSTISVHLQGAKGGTDRFAAGAYQATVTVRCE